MSLTGFVDSNGAPPVPPPPTLSAGSEAPTGAAYSLLTPVSLARRCFDAGVPAALCPCVLWSDARLEKPEVLHRYVQWASEILRLANAALAAGAPVVARGDREGHMGACRKLELRKVLAARFMTVELERERGGRRGHVCTFEVKEGAGARFQATLRSSLEFSGPGIGSVAWGRACGERPECVRVAAAVVDRKSVV